MLFKAYNYNTSNKRHEILRYTNNTEFHASSFQSHRKTHVKPQYKDRASSVSEFMPPAHIHIAHRSQITCLNNYIPFHRVQEGPRVPLWLLPCFGVTVNWSRQEHDPSQH